MAAVGRDNLRWSRDWERQILSSDLVAKLDLAGAIVEQGMKRRAPTSADGSHGRPPGYMRNSVTRRHTEHEGKPAIEIGPTALTPDGKPYPLFVEFPTRPHIIRSKGPWPLRNKKGTVFGRQVNHPGTTAQPFIRPALDDLHGRRL